MRGSRGAVDIDIDVNVDAGKPTSHTVLPRELNSLDCDVHAERVHWHSPAHASYSIPFTSRNHHA